MQENPFLVHGAGFSGKCVVKGMALPLKKNKLGYRKSPRRVITKGTKFAEGQAGGAVFRRAGLGRLFDVTTFRIRASAYAEWPFQRAGL